MDFACSLTVPCLGAESRSSTRAPVVLHHETIGGRVRERAVLEPAWGRSETGQTVAQPRWREGDWIFGCGFAGGRAIPRLAVAIARKVTTTLQFKDIPGGRSSKHGQWSVSLSQPFSIRTWDALPSAQPAPTICRTNVSAKARLGKAATMRFCIPEKRTLRIEPGICPETHSGPVG
jgi:hypothetical protein